jgi:phosphatidate cytidylyltransferase
LLKQRIITGLILAPITLGCVYLLETDFFALFCTVVIMIGAWEWGPMMGLDKTSGRAGFVAFIAVLLGALAYFFPVGAMWSATGELLGAYQSILLAGSAWWLVSGALIVSYPGSSTAWQHNRVLKGLMGVLTLVPAWVAFIAIRTVNIELEGQLYFGANLLFASLMIVWAADIGAYFCGKKFGKNKLMPLVSPNKTIEGFVGGLIWVAILVVILNLSNSTELSSYPVYLIIAIVTAIVSAVGDLSESMLKRSADIKDSGSILPGHGGLLDRIDSLVAATPVFILLYSNFAH